MSMTNEKEFDNITPSGCIACQDDQVRMNSNVTLICSVELNDVELYRCNKCKAYFEYKDDLIKFISNEHVWRVYDINPEQSMTMKTKIFILLFVWTALWAFIIFAFQLYFCVSFILGGFIIIKGLLMAENGKKFR